MTTSTWWTTWSTIFYWFVLLSLVARMLASPEHELLDANPGTFNVVHISISNVLRYSACYMINRSVILSVRRITHERVDVDQTW